MRYEVSIQFWNLPPIFQIGINRRHPCLHHIMLSQDQWYQYSFPPSQVWQCFASAQGRITKPAEKPMWELRRRHPVTTDPQIHGNTTTAHCPPNQKKILCHSIWTLDRPPLTPYIMQSHHYGNAHCPLSTYSKEATMDIGQTTTNTIYNAIPPIKRSHYGKAGSSHKLLIKRERLFSNTQLYSAFLEDHILHIRNIYKTFALGTKETSRDLVNVGIGDCCN